MTKWVVACVSACVLAGLACGGGGANVDGGGDDDGHTPGPPDASGLTWELQIRDLDEALLSAWVGGDDQILAVGGTPERGLALAHDRGAPAPEDDRWLEIPLPDGTPLLWWVWGEPGGVIFMVGEGQTILRADGGVFVRQPVDELVPPGTTFYGVWGSADDDVWVVGGSLAGVGEPGVILHWDGLSWTRATDDDARAAPLFKVWGTGADDVRAVGEEGTIVRWDGAAWTREDSGVNQRLVAVWGRGPDDVFAVGGAITGLMLHWDGAAWSSIFDAPEPLAAITILPGGGLVVGGSRGYVAAFGTAADDNLFQGGSSIAPAVDFHAAASGGTVKLLVGADLLSGGRPRWNGTLAAFPYTAGGPIVRAVDAADVDGAVDGAVDGIDVDSNLPGPGERCADPPTFPNCRPGLECWIIQVTGEPVCTQPCADVSACGAYAPACCERPGFQTLTNVCMRESSGGCGSVSIYDASHPDAAP